MSRGYLFWGLTRMNNYDTIQPMKKSILEQLLKKGKFTLIMTTSNISEKERIPGLLYTIEKDNEENFYERYLSHKELRSLERDIGLLIGIHLGIPQYIIDKNNKRNKENKSHPIVIRPKSKEYEKNNNY